MWYSINKHKGKQTTAEVYYKIVSPVLLLVYVILL